jgi:hypothetical protein
LDVCVRLDLQRYSIYVMTQHTEKRCTLAKATGTPLSTCA